MGHAALLGSGFYSLREFVIFHPAFCRIQGHLASIRYDRAVSFLYAVYVYRNLKLLIYFTMCRFFRRNGAVFLSEF